MVRNRFAAGSIDPLGIAGHPKMALGSL